jgi:N-acetylmuramoyl-L-alanine amidase
LPELDPKSSASTNFATLALDQIINSKYIKFQQKAISKISIEQWDVKGFQAGLRMKQICKIVILLRGVTPTALLAICLATAPLAIAVENGSAQTSGRTVVIDPGHGGSDTGVKGPRGTAEKDVTLRLARLIENRLKDRCRVVLTRNDDYVMDRHDRTGHANNIKADLFVSIHAAGSYSRAARGLLIYYYTTPEVKAPEQVPGPGTAAIPWRQMQNPHILASSILAQRIWNRTRPLTEPHPGSTQSAPVAVLAGADMPAILIETGYLTNPKQENNLNDNKYLFKLATAISQGIDDFFNKPDTITSTDLRE